MSTTGHYDQNLLASAPAATKAQLQEGYTTDLLNPTHRRTPSPHPVQSEDAHLAPQPDIERDSISPSKEFNSATKPLPFWRTTKGIVIIIVAILIVLGAVIGGAVGGTRNKGGSSVALATPTTTSSASPTTLPTPPGPVVGNGGLTAASSVAAATESVGAGSTSTTAAEDSVTTRTGGGPGTNQAAENIAVGS